MVINQWLGSLLIKPLGGSNTKIQKIEQSTKNEQNRKEASYRQVKQWLIMLNRLLEDK